MDWDDASNNIWLTVKKALIDAGIDTYAPQTKQGDCKAPYAVLKLDGGAKAGSFSSEYQYYTILCYVPINQYAKLKPFVNKCKDVMSVAPIYPMLMPTGTETPSFFDDTYNAYMISVQYRNIVRSEHV